MADLVGRVLGPRSSPVHVNMVAKHSWGPQPRRVVRFTITAEGDELVAAVYVPQGNRVVLHERFPISSYERTNGRAGPVVTMQLPDGSTRVAPHGGCGCGSPLKHWRPPGANVAGT